MISLFGIRKTVALALLFLASAVAFAASAPTVQLSVDASEASRKIIHAQMRIPATSGTLTLNTPTQTGLAVTPGVTMLAAGDSLVWTPAASGSAVQAFTVTVWDGYASSNTAVQVTVNVS